MKKLRGFAIVMVILACTCYIGYVKSANSNILPDDGAKISSAQIIQTKTGTGPWDDDDLPGNDSSEENDIVRSFDQVTWTVENTFALNGADAQSYQGGKLYFEVKLPADKFNSETAKWDLSSMAWVENAQLSADKMTLTGCYSLNPNAITIPGKQTVVFVANILGASNGTEFVPEFKLWLNGNTNEEKVDIQGSKITVSAAPNYNIKLIRNTNLEHRTTVNIDGEDVTGRMYGYDIVYELYNNNSSKRLKGIEYPTGNINLDINMNLTKKPAGSSVEEDISDEVTPILWNYQITGAGVDNGKIAGRKMFNGNPPNNWLLTGNDTFPLGKAGNVNCSAYDSGNVSMIQDGTKLHVTLWDYKFNGVFPRYNSGYSSNSSIAYGENRGIFGSIYFQILVPDWDEFDGITDYYLTVKDENFYATSISGLETTLQKLTNDDSNRAQYVRTKSGSYTSLVYIHKRAENSISSGGIIHSYWNYGDGRAQRGQPLLLRSQLEQGISNDEEAHMRAVNDFYKFDGDCFEPVTIGGKKINTSSSNYMTWNVWYVTKKDGTNWSSQSEMNTMKIEDCDIYENLEDIPNGKICVGMYYESISGMLPERDYWIDVPVVIKPTAVIGQTYACTSGIKYWKTEIDRSIYTITNIMSNEELDWPEDAVFDTVTNVRNYKKTEYNEQGVQISGTHAGGTYYGNTVLIVGADQSIQLSTVKKSDGTNKVNYDISKNEYDVTYKIQPKISSPYAVENVEDIAISLTVSLPDGLKYVPGSCELGEPEIVTNSNGSSTLTWLVTGCHINEAIQPLYFDAHIDENTLNGVQYEASVEMLAEPEKVGASKLADRTATTTVQIINLSSHRLFKTIETPVIEKDGEIYFTLSYKNNTDGSVPDFRLLDILPYNGDERGTDFTGTYTLDRLIVKQYDGEGNLKADNSNLTIVYTDDESIRGNITCKDENLGDEWNVITSENVLHSASAFLVKGRIEPQEVVTVDIYLKTNGNKGLDKYENNATAQVYAETEEMTTSNVTSQVVLRTIEGVAWKDANANGLKDANEEIYKDVAVTLTDANGAQVTDVDGHAVTTINTDDNGYYKFTNLPMGNYLVKVAVTDDTYMLTEKEVGSNTTINSKFNVESATTDEITKLNSLDLPELTVSNVNAGFVKKPTKVVVNYLEKGTTTKLLPENTIDGRIDDEYSTTNRLEEVNAANGNKYNYDSVDGQASGFMVEDTIYITYYYVKKDTQVKVLHVEEGTDVSDPEAVTNVLYPTETLTGKVDDSYTTSNKLNEINASHAEQYEFVRVDGNASGKMTENTITVIYYYQKKATSVVVKYIDVNSNEEVYTQTTINGRVDDNYTTVNELSNINAANDNKYEFVRVDGNASGKMTPNTTTVTYYYQKKVSSVIAKYVDVNSNEEVYTQTTINGRVDDNYTTEDELTNINAANDDKYEFVKVEGDTSGKMTANAITVTYYYQKKEANVVVKYLDVDTNEELYDEEEILGRIDDEYEAEDKVKEINEESVNKYVLDKTTENVTGNMTADIIEVIFYYKKVESQVIVKYVDENGNEIADSDYIGGYVGDEYEISTKEIDGYELLENKTSGQTKGVFGEDIIEVTYCYKSLSVDTSDINVSLYVIILTISVLGITGFAYIKREVFKNKD